MEPETGCPPLAPGLRQTLPRRLVWETIQRLGPHCTAEQIAADLEAHRLAIPRSSVYRALDALVESGAVASIHFGGGPAHYELAGREHQHALCEVCGAVLHLESALVRPLAEHLQRDYHFTPTRTEVLIVGTCAACAGAQMPGV